MAVAKIEEYRQKNGVDILRVILKPTAKFPIGYFYAPAEAIDLVKQYTWGLQACGKTSVYVQAGDYSTYHRNTLLFHTKLFEFYNNYIWQGDIDHQNHIEYDNTDQNLEPVSRQQNKFNVFSRGYNINPKIKSTSFRAKIVIDGKSCFPYSVIRNEADACNTQNYLEQVYLREKLGNDWYMFNFFKYRRGSEDLLDLERTGAISEEEAIYRHVMRYANNAWYYYRYGLQDYFKQYGIPTPQYSLDSDGFMVHPITGQRLCPF